MPLIPTIGRKSFKNRLIMAVIYLILSALGLTMVVPFMITLSGSVSGSYDYSRFEPVPRYFYSRGDRFVKNLSNYFNGFRSWQRQLKASVPGVPQHWSNWSMAGRDKAGCAALARDNMLPGNAVAAADYAEFMHDYPLDDTSVYAPQVQVAQFLATEYGSISRISEEWGTSFDSIYSIDFGPEMYQSLDFQSYFPDMSDAKFRAFCRFKEYADSFAYIPDIRRAWAKWAAREGLDCGKVFPVLRSSPKDVRDAWLRFKREFAPATMATPYPLRVVWYDYLGSEEVAQQRGGQYTLERFNKILGASYATIYETPFPIPDDFPEEIVSLFRTFQKDRYPLRLARLKVTPEMTARFREFTRRNVGRVEELNKLLGTNHASWDEIELPEVAPAGGERADVNRRNLWVNFAKTLEPGEREYESSEIRWQRFLLAKYGSLDAVNAAHGTCHARIEECFPPFAEAYRVQFANFGTAMAFAGMKDNYRMIMSYLLHTGNALPVTLALITICIVFTLTINPLAAYALSRFNLRGRDKIIVFMLATMAFPAMVSAIPAYLLMRDLGMLNTMAALVLPGAANGMAIFILKGFFDSLPMELFEAATIDGASEMQIFRIVAMPLVKPILAINCLNAFIGAYNGWEWALIICQNRDMWTLAVWMYQASMWWGGSPWVVSAGFVVISIPTMIVFISCQKVILRGIIIPSMK